MVSPPIDYWFDPEDLPDVILKDPNTPEQYSHIPVGAEDVEKEINAHISYHLDQAESAKRSAVYETVSNSPVIATALMGDLGAALLFAKTLPVYYEFYRGYDEGNDFARRLVRAKRIDNAYRQIHGRSDARIYHALGLELESDPELLNRPVDPDREKLIEESIRIVPPLSTRIAKVNDRLQMAALKLQNDAAGSLLDTITAIDDRITGTVMAIWNHDYANTYVSVRDADYKTPVFGFLNECKNDVIHLFPNPKAVYNDLTSVKKQDIKELNLNNIYGCFHAKSWGLAGTFTAACAIVAHQTVDHLIAPPTQYLYHRFAKKTVDSMVDKAAYRLSFVARGVQKLKSLWKTKDAEADSTKDQKTTPQNNVQDIEDDDDDFKVKSKPVTNPANLHRVNREYQRIMRARKNDLTSSVFNTAAIVGETYFVYGTAKEAMYSFDNADSFGDYGKAGFYSIAAVLAAAANNHICSRRVDLFNRLQSQRSQMARKNGEKVSLQDNIRIVLENIDELKTQEDPNAWVIDTVETLSLLSKIERRSFRREERNKIRLYLQDTCDDLALYDAALGDDGVSLNKIEALLDKLDENYFKELPPLNKPEDKQEPAPDQGPV